MEEAYMKNSRNLRRVYEPAGDYVQDRKIATAANYTTTAFRKAMGK